MCHTGEQPEQIFDPNQPDGPNMVARVQAIWSRNGCRCCHLVSRGVFLAVHVESVSFLNGVAVFASISTLIHRRRETIKYSVPVVVGSLQKIHSWVSFFVSRI